VVASRFLYVLNQCSTDGATLANRVALLQLNPAFASMAVTTEQVVI
jgi:hypothetical protein